MKSGSLYFPSIYLLVDPRTNIPKYIGKTNNITTRMYGHFSEKTLTKKNNWLKSLKTKGLKPIVEIIDEVREEEWQFWEQHYISLYKSWGFNLLNGDQGGLGAGRLSKETKRKISLNSPKQKAVLQYDLKGNFLKEWKTIKEASKNVNVSSTSISAACRGLQRKSADFLWQYKKNALDVKFLSARKSGWKRCQKEVLNTSKKRMKPILQLTKEGIFIKEWSCAREAESFYDISSGLIVRCCKRKHLKHAGGYAWKYKNIL